MWQKLSNYGLKLHIQQQPFPKTLIGIDFGMKSTGLAITSSDILHAFYLTTIRKDIRSREFKDDLARMINKQKPVGLIIGKPNYVVESQQKESIITLIDEFIAGIQQEPSKLQGCKYTIVDESWTTLDAKTQLKAIQSQIKHWGHLRREKELIDGMAAVNILRRYLQFFNRN